MILLPLLLAVAILVGTTSVRAEPFVAGHALDQRLVADVMGAALAFMAPRTLEPVPTSDLTMWALRGLTTLDPRLQPELRGGTLRLLAPGRVLLARAPPADGDAAGWGAAAAQLARAGWDASDAVRKARTDGVIQTLFDELFNHLDPYSHYTPPAQAAEARLRREGTGGVGLRVAERAGGFVVFEVAPDGPGALAGLRVGESLLAVDGQAIQGADLADVVAMLAGPEGSRVTLTLRAADGHVRETMLTRVILAPRTVSVERTADILLVRVTGFASDTGARLAHALQSGLAGPRRPRGVVLDLRGNRGGLLWQAVAAAETVLASGMVAATAGRDPRAAHVFVAAGRDLSDGLPIIVTVDGRSASAAEILAAALADQRRAVVVGSATLGKGLVQTLTSLPDGGELAVTWSRVLAPLGWPIQGLGVLPQVCTSLGEAALLRQLDALAHGEQSMARALTRARTARPPLPAAEALEIRAACPAAVGRDLDLTAASRLIRDPAAYAAALLGPPRADLARDLTTPATVRN